MVGIFIRFLQIYRYLYYGFIFVIFFGKSPHAVFSFCTKNFFAQNVEKNYLFQKILFFFCIDAVTMTKIYPLAYAGA